MEFVCLKQNYDTTTPQGRLFVTMMMALAEFEREQTSERNREATAARAERGLWNGGRLIGYDLDPSRKGNLIPNPEEVALVNLAFDTYLACGSIAGTATALNRRGRRTKVTCCQCLSRNNLPLGAHLASPGGIVARPRLARAPRGKPGTSTNEVTRIPLRLTRPRATLAYA
ncbi:MAG: recombinase family protein [Dehalococcoidia bacterium]|nr:recombinase family protein [Dehalococcoidia bacterium]